MHRRPATGGRVRASKNVQRRRRTALFELLGCARHLMHGLAIERVNPGARPAPLLAHTQFSLVSVQHLPALVHDHVCPQRQSAQRAVADPLHGRGVGDPRGDAQRAIGSLPAGQALPHLCAVVVLV